MSEAKYYTMGVGKHTKQDGEDSFEAENLQTYYSVSKVNDRKKLN